MSEKPTQTELNTGSIRDLGHQITLLNENIDSLKQRVAALEAAPDAVGQQDFKPGWEAPQGSTFVYGLSGQESEFAPSITLDYTLGEETAILYSIRSTRINLTARQLRELIGAAMAVLRRMEADNADLSG